MDVSPYGSKYIFYLDRGPRSMGPVCFLRMRKLSAPGRSEGAEVFKKHVRDADDHVGAKCEIRTRRGLSTAPSVCPSVRLSVCLSVTYRTSLKPVNHSGWNFQGTIGSGPGTHISEIGPIGWDSAELRAKNCQKAVKKTRWEGPYREQKFCPKFFVFTLRFMQF